MQRNRSESCADCIARACASKHAEAFEETRRPERRWTEMEPQWIIGLRFTTKDNSCPRQEAEPRHGKPRQSTSIVMHPKRNRNTNVTAVPRAIAAPFFNRTLMPGF